MEWIDTPGEISAVLGIGSLLIASLFWVVQARVNQVLHETKPNSGSSMRDVLMTKLDSIETQLRSVERKIDHHIEWHLEEK